MHGSAVRKVRRTLPVILIVLLFFTAGAQVNVRNFTVMDGSYNYTRKCRFRIVYTEKAPVTLDYSAMRNLNDTCGMISSIQFLPAVTDTNEYYPLQPIDCRHFSMLKPVVKIALLNKYNPPPMAYDGIIDPDTLSYYVKTPEIDRYTRMVCEQLKIPAFAEYLNVVGASVPTFAETRTYKDNSIFCYLYYNPDVLSKLISDGDTLVICGILLHELGHIANQQTLRIDSSNIEAELSADEYAGRWLYTLGADPGTIDKMVSFLRILERTEMYPSKQERKDRLLFGWQMERDAVQLKARQDSIREYRDLDSVQANLIDRKLYKDAITWLNRRMQTLNTKENILTAVKMLGGAYFALAEARNDTYKYAQAISEFDKYLENRKDIDVYFKIAYSTYVLESYAKADSFFMELLTMQPDRVMKGRAFYYSGLCKAKMDSLDSALEALDQSAIEDPSNPDVFEKRGEVKKVLFSDSLIAALGDYNRALETAIVNSEQVRLNKVVQTLAGEVFRQAVNRGSGAASRTYADLKFLQDCRLDAILPDFDFGMAACFYDMSLSAGSGFTLNDSVIHYCSEFLDRKPPDSARALLLRGKVRFSDYLQDPADRASLQASFTDLGRVPVRVKEYPEAAFLLTRISVLNKEYCNLLRYYDTVSPADFKKLIKQEMCRVSDEVRRSDCYKHKDKQKLKAICETE